MDIKSFQDKNDAVMLESEEVEKKRKGRKKKLSRRVFDASPSLEISKEKSRQKVSKLACSY